MKGATDEFLQQERGERGGGGGGRGGIGWWGRSSRRFSESTCVSSGARDG